LGYERYRQRRQLMEIDDRQLKDIGITRETGEAGSTQADLGRLADGCYALSASTLASEPE